MSPRVLQSGKQLAYGQSSELGMAEATGTANATGGHLDDPAILNWVPIIWFKADLASRVDNARAVAAVIGQPERCESSKGIIVRAVVAGTKGDRRRSAGGGERGSRVVKIGRAHV